MITGQYRTQRLTVTKSYIQYKSRRIELSEIASVQRLRIRFKPILLLTVLFGITVIYFDANIWALVILLVCLLAEIGRINTLRIVTTSGSTITLDLASERSTNRAINTILNNVAEFQSKTKQISFMPPSDKYLNPEEHIRQYVLRLLTIQLGYSPNDIGYEFPLQMGSSQKRADLVVFFPRMPHTQDNIQIIVECKRYDIGNDIPAVNQLKSYMAVCVNARYGVVASNRWLVFEKAMAGGRYVYQTLPSLVGATGQPVSIIYMPGQPVLPIQPEPDISELSADDADFAEMSFSSLLSRWARVTFRIAVVCLFGLCGLTLIINAISDSSAQGTNTSRDILPQITNTWVTFTSSPVGSATARSIESGFVTATSPVVVETSPVNIMQTNEATHTPTITPYPFPVLVLTPSQIPMNAESSAQIENFGFIEATRNVNLRMSPSTQASIIRSVTPGTRIIILETNETGTWLRIRIDATTIEGWVATSLVRISQ
ncbi:MAG: type I restriction enzyme HsdR N-terminal domain-containing protein [Pleurocapsa minor GSE-CHR-MK-17-07R]|nr:type I restriction enzyme HsdR N-terminal domain-containing protein [Pleurocapsa minor GSE-CHR-MK 17-07R]